jgi:signal transduction histidine kinase
VTDALDELVEHRRAGITLAYEAARRDRKRLAAFTYALLGGVALVSLMVAWMFSRRLARAYREESDAVEAARRAVTARDDLMGVLAHDLRNPLGAISTKAAVVREAAASEVLREQADSIANIAMRMEYLIRSILDVTVVEAGRFSVEQQEVDAEDLLREIVEMFGFVASSKGVALERRGASGVRVFADRERILQVLSNLVGNALKFTPPRGRVTLSLERVAGAVRFSVSDTGAGIPAAEQERIFDRFWTRDRATSRGTGLGLFIAKAIVEAHGGKIWVDSAPGQGSTFRFTLPPPEAGRVSEPATTPIAGRPLPA